MNYQKLFSRFYSATDLTNSELLQKYNNVTTNISGFVNISNEERTPNRQLLKEENQLDEFEFPPTNLPEEDEVLFVSTSSETNMSPAWEPLGLELSSSVVEPLTPEEVRWFYKPIDDKVWSEFNGYDSLLIENKYRETYSAEWQLKQESDTGGTDVVTLHKVSFNSDQNTFLSEDTVVSLPVDTGKDELCTSPVKKCKKDDDLGAKISLNGFTSEQDEALLDKDQSCDGVFKDCSSKSNSQDSSKNESFDDDVSLNAERIVVRGGMYEVDLKKMSCESIYWPGEKCVITRGLYFYDGSWQPLEGRHGEVLEVEHLRLFGQKAVEGVEKQAVPPGVAVHSEHFQQFHVEWMSSCEVYLYWGGAPRQLVRSVTQKLGFYQSTGYRLRRGYRTRASVSERPPDITHVVFVIHGIGQKMDAGRIIRNTNALRASCDWLRIQYNISGRAELFPARWRAGERGAAAAILAAAAPPGAPALRRAINDAAMDVMYYTSQLYGKQVQDDLRKELNRLHTMFMARNPTYTGGFSAVAHSLGCVILYDIITNYNIGCDKCADSLSGGTRQVLTFPLSQVFCLGSPLSVFLAMRHPEPSLHRVLPPDFHPKLYNIFHLSDPVAYRMEPLISQWHASRPPVVIQPYHAAPPASPTSQASPAKGPWRIWSYVKHPWQRSESGSPITVNNSQHNTSIEMNDVASTSRSTNAKVSCDTESDIYKKDLSDNVAANYQNDITADNVEFLIPSLDYKKVLKDIASNEKKEDAKALKNVIEENSKDDIVKGESAVTEEDITKGGDKKDPEDNLPYRIDYTVRDTGITNNYLSAITSHTSYWHNYDIAYFILTHLNPSEKVKRDEGNADKQSTNYLSNSLHNNS